MTSYSIKVDCNGPKCGNEVDVSASKAQELTQHANPRPVFCSKACEMQYNKFYN